MLLTRLMNAPVNFQKTIATGILVLLFGIIGIMAWLGIVVIQDQRSALHEMRERAGKLTRMVAMKNNLQPSNAPAIANDDRQLFLEAESITIGRANLQSSIDAIAQSNGLVLASAGGVPDIDEKGIALIGIRIDASGSYEALQKALVDIETSKPPLMVRELVMRLASGEAGDRPVELAAQIKIFGAFRLTGATAQSAAAQEGNPQ